MQVRMCVVNFLIGDTNGSKLVLLEWSHEVLFLFDSLEATMTNLGGGIDEFEFDFFQIFSLVMSEKRFSDDNWTLSDTHARTFDDQEIVLDFTVMRKSTERINRFISDIGSSGSIVLDKLSIFGFITSTNSVNLLVDFNTVMVTFLTTTSNSVRNTCWMPCTNTSDFTETTMGFSWEFFSTPTRCYTLATMTLSDTDAIDVFVLSNDVMDCDVLFEETEAEIDFGSGVTTVDLEFEEMGFLLFEWEKFHLGVSDQSDNWAVFLQFSQFSFSTFLIFIPLLRVLSESLLLRRSPVLIKSSLALVRNMFTPDGFKSSQASWSFNISNNTNTNHWWCFQNSHRFNNFFLVKFRSLTGNFTNDVCHTSFVTNETS